MESTPLLTPASTTNEPTFSQSMKSLIYTNKWFNLILLIFLPLGLLSSVLRWSETSVFILNFIAIICLAKMLDLTTDQLSKRLGQTLGSLINASFGNAVELIVGILALNKGLVTVVQSSLIGSILSNLLLVLGLCLFMGGLKYPNQTFNAKAANVDSSLLLLTMLGFLLPAAFQFHLDYAKDENSALKQLAFSHATSIALLIAYISFLLFQLVTHASVFESAEDEDEEPMSMSVMVATSALLISTILIGISAEFLVDSIEGISKDWGLSEAFIGLILLPIVGNAAEHVTAVFSAMRNKMDLAIGVSLGSSLQISMFVTPVLVIAGWIFNVPLTLDFPIFDLAVLFVSINCVTHLINDGQSNWLEGLMLLLGYFIVAIGYYLL
ncbi:Sodium/calcium exchanger protein-domain-containing protein [Globomyces pollinis-pini]|nr:Sodium/calcium exchanger protein-domain-containing protein [Globomyces pollinis-pini]